MSHVLQVGVANQIAYFRAYNTDGTAKVDLTSATTGLSISVFRIGASSVSIASLSNKAADDTAHADGAIRNVGGNLYTIDLPDAACATQCPSICVRGLYAGGVVEGIEHPIVAYDPSVVAVGANTTTPPSAASVADAVWDEATVDHTSTGSFGAKVGSLSTSSVTVAPLQATAPNRVAGTEIVTYINDTSEIGPIVVTDGDGDAVDLSSYTLKVCIERKENGTIDDNITPTISGAGNNQVTFTPTAACVNSTTPRKWSLRSTSNGQVFAFGDFKVEWPARLS